MKTGRYNIRELLTHNEIEQIIIPEIQRDYVWQKSNVKSLVESIIERFKRKSTAKIEISIDGTKRIDDSINEYLQKEYDKLKNNLKVGFIYAYHDNEFAGKFFLIDGQQRFTTLYLLLLAIYVKNKEVDAFRELYFKDKQLKIDYKVRESSHEFMREFFDNELNISKMHIIKNSSKYYNDIYDKDVTVINLIQNYEEICNLLEGEEKLNNKKTLNEFVEFVEEFIEVNYFDTNLSQQGEQLYLYMNSRGEFLSHHEIIKSEIVKKVGEGVAFIKKKKEVGDNWEVWQNFFWKHRGDNESADIGFDEFLKWASILHICTEDSPKLVKEIVKDRNQNPVEQTQKQAKENYIHRTDKKIETQKRYLSKYQIQSLDYEYLQSCYDAVHYLAGIETIEVGLNSKWLHNIGGAINYVVLLPLLYFVKNTFWDNELEKKKDVERLAMFLKNITYFESIYKNPDSAVIDTIELVKRLCDHGEKDITAWESDKELDGQYKSILTSDERNKLMLYKASGDNRLLLEKTIWNITKDERVISFLKGNISILFHTVDLKDVDGLLSESLIPDNIILIDEYYKILSSIISDFDLYKANDKADLFRRALLTFGDYSVKTIGSYRFGDRIEGYTFGYYFNRDNKEWEQILAERKDIWANFLYSVRIQKPNSLTDFINTFDVNDWREPFINYEEHLSYCLKKRILFKDDHHIYLIQEKDMGYKEIQTFLLSLKLKKELRFNVDTFSHNICVLNVLFDENMCQLKYDEGRNQYAIHITKVDDNWYSKLIYKDEHEIEGKFDAFLNEDWVFNNELQDRIEKENNLLYKYNPELSIIQNVDKVTEEVVKLYFEIGEILRQQQQFIILD